MVSLIRRLRCWLKRHDYETHYYLSDYREKVCKICEYTIMVVTDARNIGKDRRPRNDERMKRQ